MSSRKSRPTPSPVPAILWTVNRPHQDRSILVSDISAQKKKEARKALAGSARAKEFRDIGDPLPESLGVRELFVVDARAVPFRRG